MARKALPKPKEKVILELDGEEYEAVVMGYSPNKQKVKLKFGNGEMQMHLSKNIKPFVEEETPKPPKKSKNTKTSTKAKKEKKEEVDEDVDSDFSEEDLDEGWGEIDDDIDEDVDEEVDVDEDADVDDEDIDVDEDVDDDLDDDLDDGFEEDFEEEATKKSAKNKSSKPSKEDNDDNEDDDASDYDEWYSIGDGEDDKFDDSLGSTTYRFWIPKGSTRNITFLTGKAFTYKEHNFKKAGSFKNWATCIAGSKEACPICENQNRSYVAKAFYIVDHHPYINKAGKEIKDQVRLLVFKPQSYELFKAQVDAYFDGDNNDGAIDLRGLRVAIHRTNGEKSYSTGNVFTIKGKGKIPASFKENINDLKKELKPYSREKLLKVSRYMEDSNFNDDDE